MPLKESVDWNTNRGNNRLANGALACEGKGGVLVSNETTLSEDHSNTTDARLFACLYLHQAPHRVGAPLSSTIHGHSLMTDRTKDELTGP